MTEQRSVEQWVSLVGSILIPAGAVTALLFYFGYASARAQYEYFGIDIDTVGLDTRDFLIRSPRPLLVPLLLLALVALACVWVHIVLRDSIDGAEADPPRASALGLGAIRRGAAITTAVGTILLIAGICLVLAYPLLVDWAAYDMLAPILVANGVFLFSYGAYLRSRLRRLGRSPGEPAARTGHSGRAAWLLAVVVIAGSIFWATSTLARWSGRGLAVTASERFHMLPKVIVDTKERLYLPGHVIGEAALPPTEGQTFRYRYTNLRLLIEGQDRMFLVPNEWADTATTLVLPLDESVRVQFQFQNPG
jgi:hypothetical protein